MGRQVAYRKKKRNNVFSMLFVCVAVLLLLVVVVYRGAGIKERLAVYEERTSQLQAQIDAELERSEELEEFEKYTQTKQYMEEIAKDKLGLVYEGEILFKQEN